MVPQTCHTLGPTQGASLRSDVAVVKASNTNCHAKGAPISSTGYIRLLA